MATQPIGSPSTGQSGRWSTLQSSMSSSTCNRSYQLAALRAGVIALVLLAILVLVVLT